MPIIPLLELQVVPCVSRKAAHCHMVSLSLHHTLRHRVGQAITTGCRGDHGEVKGQVITNGKEWRESDLK